MNEAVLKLFKTLTFSFLTNKKKNKKKAHAGRTIIIACLNTIQVP